MFVDCYEVYALAGALTDDALLLPAEVLVDFGLHGTLLFCWLLPRILGATYK